MYVEMGNVATLESRTAPDGETQLHDVEGNRTFIMRFPDDWTFMEALNGLLSPQGAWTRHSLQPPAWVHSDDSAFEDAVRRHFGVGPKPTDWVEHGAAEDDLRHGANDPRAEEVQQ